MGYRLFTDVCADLPLDYIRANDLRVVSMPVTVDGRQYAVAADPNDPVSISTKLFYDMLRMGTMAKTAQTSISMFINAFEPVLMAGGDILCIAFSSALSGTYNSACAAASELMEKYRNRKIVVIDSLCASLGQGLLVDMAIKQRDEGMSLEDLEVYILDMRHRIQHWFTVDDLAHLRRGGRISGATAVVGTVLAIKPILRVNPAGELVPVDKTQGRKRSIKYLVDKAVSGIDMATLKQIYISHGDVLEEAEWAAGLVKEKVDVEVLVNVIDPIIGCHSGPGTIAIFFVSKEPRQ